MPVEACDDELARLSWNFAYMRREIGGIPLNCVYLVKCSAKFPWNLSFTSRPDLIRVRACFLPTSKIPLHVAIEILSCGFDDLAVIHYIVPVLPVHRYVRLRTTDNNATISPRDEVV